MEEKRLIASYEVEILLNKAKCNYSQAQIICELVQKLEDRGKVLTTDQIKHLQRYVSGGYQQAVSELKSKTVKTQLRLSLTLKVKCLTDWQLRYDP